VLSTYKADLQYGDQETEVLQLAHGEGGGTFPEQ